MKWTARIVICVLVVAVNVPLFVVPYITHGEVYSYQYPSPTTNPPPVHPFPEHERERPVSLVDRLLSNKLFIATAIVLIIFFADVLVLWILSKIGGPLRADVKASLKKVGGSVWIGSAGLLGAFLALAFVAFSAVYVFAH